MANNRPNNLMQYGVRAAKSLVHTSLDVAKEMNPTINSFVETNRDFFSEIKDKSKKRR